MTTTKLRYPRDALAKVRKTSNTILEIATLLYGYGDLAFNVIYNNHQNYCAVALPPLSGEVP